MTIRFGSEFSRPLLLLPDDPREFLIINGEISFVDPADFRGVDYPLLITDLRTVSAEIEQIAQATYDTLQDAERVHFQDHMHLLAVRLTQYQEEPSTPCGATAWKVAACIALLVYSGLGFWFLMSKRASGSVAPFPD